MNIKLRTSIITVILPVLLAACSETNVYMVRHADKALAPANDPPLNATGQQRAVQLKDALKKASIDAIIVSDFQRTQQTAQPLADELNILPIVIPLKNSTPDAYVQAVVNEVKTNWKGRDVLVVSHNTLLQQIGEELGTPAIDNIPESTYNKFYLIQLGTSSSSVPKFAAISY